VRDGLKLFKLRAEIPMSTLIELIDVKKKREKPTLACKGDTLPALLVWFHHNLAGFSNCNNDVFRDFERNLPQPVSSVCVRDCESAQMHGVI
jgi:hypothetical protein